MVVGGGGGLIFYHRNFCFRVVKVLMSISELLPTLCVCEKLEQEH